MAKVKNGQEGVYEVPSQSSAAGTVLMPGSLLQGYANNRAPVTGRMEVAVIDQGREELGYDVTDGTIESKCEACRNLKGVRWLAFLVLLFLDFAEFVFDWMFFYEIVTLRTGLVFAAPERALVWALLTLCCLGSIVFIIETWNMYRSEVQNNRWSMGYAPTLVDIWLVNIPTGIINVRIAACYESAISYVQLAKALVAMFLVFVKIISAVVGYCQVLRLRSRYKQKGIKSDKFPMIVKLAILVGVVGILICSSFVMALTHMTTVKHGHNTFLTFRSPDSWDEVKVDTSKYFDDVSVYLQHPSFSESCGISSGGNRWMQLNSIYEVINAEDRGILVTFGNYKQDIRNQYFYVAKMWPYQNKSSDEHCYHRDLSTCAMYELSCESISSIVSKADNLTVRMLFEPSSEYVLIGNLNYNGHVQRNTSCTPLTQDKKAMEDLIGKLNYFRNVDASVSPLSYKNNQNFFYSYSPGSANSGSAAGMRHVSNEWTTGMFSCKAYGYTGPTYDKTVIVHTC